MASASVSHPAKGRTPDGETGNPPPPFFIVGAPRTGSTLLRRMLCEHPRVAIPPESGFMADYLSAEHVPLERRRRLLADDPELAYWNLPPAARDLSHAESMGVCFALLHRRYAEAQGKDVWGNKTPRLVWHADLLLRHFPDARFIHLVRDGRAVARSLRASAAHQLPVRRGARRYARDTTRGLMLERAHPDRTLRVRYEDLLRRPEDTLRRVCAFIGVPFERRMLQRVPEDALRLTPAERRSGHHAHVQEAPEPAFIDRWKEELDETDLRLVEEEAAPVLAALGYSTYATGRPPWHSRVLAELAHARWVVTGAWKELFRADLWPIVHRRAVLGTLDDAVRFHVRGGAPLPQEGTETHPE